MWVNCCYTMVPFSAELVNEVLEKTHVIYSFCDNDDEEEN